MGNDEILQVLKEKIRLEGQLESLSSEANQVIQPIDFYSHIFCCKHQFKDSLTDM